MDIVQCPNPKCKAVIGEAVNINGLTLLRVGNAPFLIRELNGICMQCGRVFYWSVSDRIIYKIVRSAQFKEIFK